MFGSSLSVCSNLVRIASKIGAPRMVNLHDRLIKPYESSFCFCDRSGHLRIVGVSYQRLRSSKLTMVPGDPPSYMTVARSWYLSRAVTGYIGREDSDYYSRTGALI